MTTSDETAARWNTALATGDDATIARAARRALDEIHERILAEEIHGVAPAVTAEPEPVADILSFTDPVSHDQWTARLVRPGGHYGLGLRVEHPADGEAMVEFYDCRFAAQFVDQNGGHPWGQFVSRYYVSSIAARNPAYGLSLEGSAPRWTLSAEAMTLVTAWLSEALPQGAATR